VIVHAMLVVPVLPLLSMSHDDRGWHNCHAKYMWRKSYRWSHNRCV